MQPNAEGARDAPLCAIATSPLRVAYVDVSVQSQEFSVQELGRMMQGHSQSGTT